MVLAVVTPVLVLLLKLMWRFFRAEVRGDASFRETVGRGQPVVLAFWHEGLLAISWYIARLLGEGIKITYLISPSVDGEIGVQILARFGSKAVRGSSRRSGAAALRGLVATIRRDRQSPCIAIDGSKGPRRYCKPGAIMVARLAGAPIVPIGFAASRAWRLPSWDRHVVPKLFARVMVAVGEPFEVGAGRNEEDMERQRLDLEARVNELMHFAEETIGAVPDRSAAVTDPWGIHDERTEPSSAVRDQAGPEEPLS
jgi:lysophospholipid acyltransferase (LPLAT)-like uncharacterized protein